MSKSFALLYDKKQDFKAFKEEIANYFELTFHDVLHDYSNAISDQDYFLVSVRPGKIHFMIYQALEGEALEKLHEKIRGFIEQAAENSDYLYMRYYDEQTVPMFHEIKKVHSF